MRSRARSFLPVVAGAALGLAALGSAGDAGAAKANTFTIDYPPLGFKVAIAVPEDGQLCIVLPESAQDPAACLGLDTEAMAAAFPEGPGRPFGVAKARMGDWSYLVMLVPVGSGIESKEDIDEYVAGALPGPSEPGATPKLLGPSPDRTYEIQQIKGIPVVKFRLDTGVPPASLTYDTSAMLHYAAFGGATAMVSFITSPKDVERVLPYAEATVQSLVLPPHPSPDRFGKPRAELERAGSRTVFGVFLALVLGGTALFWWLGRGKKDDDGEEKAGGEKGKKEEEKA